MPGATKTTRNWFAAIFHDLFLMLAQAMDLPFMRLSEEVKKLIAFAGLVLLASGSVLLIVDACTIKERDLRKRDQTLSDGEWGLSQH